MFTILVADDDPDLRELLVLVLSDAGHRVLTASDGYEAIRLMSEGWVDLLITDVRMPGINGYELAQQAKLIQSSLHVIYLTGYGGKGEIRRGPIYGRVLEKPIRPAELVREVQRELLAY